MSGLVSRSLKVVALVFSSVPMLPVIHGVRLGYVHIVTVGMTSSMHLFMKRVTDVVNTLMSSVESGNIIQSALAKQSCSLASASSDLLRIVHVIGTSCLSFCL